MICLKLDNNYQAAVFNFFRLFVFLSIIQEDFSINQGSIKYPFTWTKFYWIQKNKRKDMNLNTLKMYVEKKTSDTIQEKNWHVQIKNNWLRIEFFINWSRTERSKLQKKYKMIKIIKISRVYLEVYLPSGTFR